MDPVKSPRKELQIQGPRPAPLKIHKDSHKIRKPPVPPPPGNLPPASAPVPRQPVIIYAVSPKVIHTNPSEFMNLVQRLTGLSSSSSTNSGGSMSPAARYATVEKANNRITDHYYARGSFGIDHNNSSNSNNINSVELGFHDQSNNNNKGFLSAGILSPGPSSLAPISPGFFSPPSDTFFNDLLISPAIQGGASPIVGPSSSSSAFFVSPRSFVSPTTPSIDHLFFNNIFYDHSNNNNNL